MKYLTFNSLGFYVVRRIQNPASRPLSDLPHSLTFYSCCLGQARSFKPAMHSRCGYSHSATEAAAAVVVDVVEVTAAAILVVGVTTALDLRVACSSLVWVRLLSL